MVTSTRGVGYAACSDALAHWDFAGQLKEITVPVLTVAGAEDESTPPAALQAIADGVAGEVRAEVISPAAHVPTVESPEQVNALLVQFLG